MTKIVMIVLFVFSCTLLLLGFGDVSREQRDIGFDVLPGIGTIGSLLSGGSLIWLFFKSRAKS